MFGGPGRYRWPRGQGSKPTVHRRGKGKCTQGKGRAGGGGGRLCAEQGKQGDLTPEACGKEPELSRKRSVR